MHRLSRWIFHAPRPAPVNSRARFGWTMTRQVRAGIVHNRRCHPPPRLHTSRDRASRRRRTFRWNRGRYVLVLGRDVFRRCVDRSRSHRRLRGWLARSDDRTRNARHRGSSGGGGSSPGARPCHQGATCSQIDRRRPPDAGHGIFWIEHDRTCTRSLSRRRSPIYEICRAPSYLNTTATTCSAWISSFDREGVSSQSTPLDLWGASGAAFSDYWLRAVVMAPNPLVVRRELRIDDPGSRLGH